MVKCKGKKGKNGEMEPKMKKSRKKEVIKEAEKKGPSNKIAKGLASLDNAYTSLFEAYRQIKTQMPNEFVQLYDNDRALGPILINIKEVMEALENQINSIKSQLKV